jgi:hypothetical protein
MPQTINTNLLVEAHLRGHEPITLAQAKNQLRQRRPLWILDFDGSLLACNLLALWLWGFLKSGQDIDVHSLLGTKVFSVFARNLYRIPPADNVRFYEIKCAIARWIERFYPERPEIIDAFKAAVLSRPDTAKIWNQAQLAHLKLNRPVWTYPLNITPPESDDTSLRLEMQTTVTLVRIDQKQFQFIAYYQPLQLTTYVFEEQYKKLIDLYGKISYVQPYGFGGELDNKEIQPNGIGEHLKGSKELLIPEPITLYADASEQSQQAFNALEKAGLRFRVLPASEYPAPYATWEDDMVFEGLTNVQSFADALHHFDSEVKSSLGKWKSAAIRNPNQELIDWMEELRQRQLGQARAELARMRAHDRESNGTGIR